VSVVEVPHQYSPVSVMRLDGERLQPWQEGATVTRRQDKPRLFARNGPAAPAVRAEVVRTGSLYGHDCRPLVMTMRESYDIDTPDDLELVELLLLRR
jgi:CMP-N-acetylneuraminic acid synthetase